MQRGPNLQKFLTKLIAIPCFHYTGQLSQRSNFCFEQAFSLFSLTIASDSSWNALLLKVILSGTFQKWKILYDFFDLTVYSLTSKLIKIHRAPSKWKQKSFQASPVRNALSIKSGSFQNGLKNDPGIMKTQFKAQTEQFKSKSQSIQCSFSSLNLSKSVTQLFAVR